MLKKIAAILLLGIFLFNWFGYRIVTSLLQFRATSLLERSLHNNDYHEWELISIKLPANLPYYINSPDYVRADGEITVEGQHYNFVKRRLFNDSLEFLCIPNEQKMKLAHARDEYYKGVNDLKQPSKSEKAGAGSLIVKNLLFEYCQEFAAAYHFNWSNDLVSAHATYLTEAMLHPSLSRPGEPPEA